MMEIFVAMYTSYGWDDDSDSTYAVGVSLTFDGAKALADQYAARSHGEVEWDKKYSENGKVSIIGSFEIITGKMDVPLV